uniref:NADH-ubiquinone oxidoreductase chain 4 n=1 Tax=Rhinebothrium scobinae TaxID=3079055 RepID=A0A8K1SXD9_9CEST|nr:NADH dehydrogenase subunit 4 [Rhinebothrium scobinae]UFQ88750.1 NADH dehydrogenase subunit 4 [Rhinebothrium scobinae]
MSMYNLFSCSFFLAFAFIAGVVTLFSAGVIPAGIASLTSEYFLFDSLSFYMLLLVGFLGCYSLLSLNAYMNTTTFMFLGLSLLFSGLCFCVNHSVLFWCFYELSMLPLLFLIFKDSPYSERFIAGWYFAVYLLVTSLPLILGLLYLSIINGTPFISEWSKGTVSTAIYIVLSFIFFTKVPLSPFHTWLPIVHAEATSIVSIFLSGYIMKLGLLGVFRCSPFLFDSGFYTYLFFCCVFSIFFMITASGELDGKRWLAFLSLSHIVVAFIAFFVCDWSSISLAFIFCLGHGLSAGLVFGTLWLYYDSSNSRNWLLLKEGVSGKASLFAIVVSLLSLCSFPPTLQFFCEVSLLTESTFSVYFMLFWGCYLFLGGLVPLVLCSHILIRTESVESSAYTSSVFFFYFFYLSLWCYLGLFIL